MENAAYYQSKLWKMEILYGWRGFPGIRSSERRGTNDSHSKNKQSRFKL